MADTQYNGILSSVFCGLCDKSLTLESIREHPCFSGAADEEIMLMGNVIDYQPEKISSSEGGSEPYITGEYSEEFPMSTSNARDIPRESETAVNRDVGFDIELDEAGDAAYSHRNMSYLVELVRREPIIWDYRLPICRRSNGAIAEAWVKIASYFKGWGSELTRRRFTNLKGSYTRKRKYPPSGSAGVSAKKWAFDDSLSFLDDVTATAERTTKSNVSPPRKRRKVAGEGTSSQEDLNYPSVSEEDGSARTGNNNFGFISTNSSSKRRKPNEDPLESAVLELVTRKSLKSSRKELNAIEQWGVWLASELAEITEDTKRLQVQSFITSYIAEKRMENVL